MRAASVVIVRASDADGPPQSGDRSTPFPPSFPAPSLSDPGIGPRGGPRGPARGSNRRSVAGFSQEPDP